jgi:anti-sigma B factor antagonist
VCLGELFFPLSTPLPVRDTLFITDPPLKGTTKEGELSMSMKANVQRDANGNIIIQMEGDLNYDHSLPLRNQLQSISNLNPNSSITIDLSAMDFVGSSGICHFVETVKFLKEGHKSTVLLSNVRPEFFRIFKLYSLNEADYVAEMMNFDTDETENLNSKFGNRNHTFEN